MSKEFLQKPRYEFYNGTLMIVDNELDEFVDNVVDRLNTQDFNKKDLLKVKQNQEKQIAELQKRLEEKEKEVEKLRKRHSIKDNTSQCEIVNGVEFNTEQIMIWPC